MSLPKFEYLEITGPVSVVPVTGNINRHISSRQYLIIGETGAGKSSFIEALAGESHGLEISGHQLAPVTQRVTAYELLNVRRYGDPVYILDTPGFSDSKLSDGEIVDMVKTWIEDNGSIHGILFFLRINATRIEGTKRRTIKMVRELISGNDLRCMTFVTTMWNQLGSEWAQQRADSNFKYLGNRILKEWIDQGARLTTFENTQSSALESLNSGYFWDMVLNSQPTVLYHDLQDRILTALQEKQMIERELTNPKNVRCIALLERDQVDNEGILVKFIGRLRRYGEPPEGYEDKHAEVLAAITALGDELGSMEERVRNRELALAKHRVLRQNDLERQSPVKEVTPIYRIQQKMHDVGTSIVNKVKRIT